MGENSNFRIHHHVTLRDHALDLVRMLLGIMRRMMLGRVHFVATYLKKRMRGYAARMMFGRIRAILSDHVERLGHIRMPSGNAVNLAVFHRHKGLGSVDLSDMAVVRLVQELHTNILSYENSRLAAAVWLIKAIYFLVRLRTSHLRVIHDSR